MTRNGHQRQSPIESAATPGENDPASVNATDGNPLGLRDLDPPEPPQPWRWLGLFTFAVLAMAMLATVIVASAAADKKAAQLGAEEKRLSESVTARAKILRTWLEGRHAASRRLTNSDVFRLFVTDLALQEPNAPLPRSLQDQKPYFQQLITDFAKQNDLARAAVLRRDGAVLLSSTGPTLSVTDLLRQFESATPGESTMWSPLREIDDEAGMVVVDAVLPMPKVQSGEGSQEEPSALLVLTLSVDGILDDVLSNKRVDADDEIIAILQQRGDVFERIQLAGNSLALVATEAPEEFSVGKLMPFGRRSDDGIVYSVGAPLEDVGWTLHHAVDARFVLAPVQAFVKAATVVSVMAIFLLTAAFAAFWWRQGRDHHRRLVELYRAHAAKIDHQHQLLTSVTRSIGDWLIVSAPDGRLIYANPAFEAACKSSAASTPGQSWQGLVQKRAALTHPADDLLSLMDAGDFEMVDIGGDQRIISERMSDLHHADGCVAGTVRVVRDHTDLAVERRKRLKSLAQTIDAFVHAIELRDPFLLGHTRRLRSCAIAIGRYLRLSDAQLSDLALAASLSQIGKIFIPDDILAKPDRHNAEEESIMRDHILHAVDILDRLALERPIVDALAHMHERLDGSGYPKGLSGEQINLGARILGVADVFCARTAPRSYRDRQSAGKTLYHLACNEERYDVTVVAALADVVGRGNNVDDGDMDGQHFIDSAVWQSNRRDLEQPAETVCLS